MRQYGRLLLADAHLDDKFGRIRRMDFCTNRCELYLREAERGLQPDGNARLRRFWRH